MASLSIAEQSNLIQWLFSTRTFQRFQAKELLVYVLVYWKTDDTKYIEKNESIFWLESCQEQDS